MFESPGERLSLAALIGAFVVAGCGGDTSGSRPKIDGGTATGGVVTGTGGTSAGSATGGSAGAQPCLKTPAPNTHISDFTVWDRGNWGYPDGDLTGGQSLYSSDASAAFTATVDTTLDNPYLVLTANDGIGAYSGYVMWFASCLDASKAPGDAGHPYAGIQFKVKGVLGGASLQFQVQTSTNYPIDGKNQKGECVGGWGSLTCNNNYVEVTVTSEWTTVSYTWEEFTGGYPVTHLDPSNILGIQWQANCPTSAKAPCVMEIDLDRVEFFPP
jgi:hypothetical protein